MPGDWHAFWGEGGDVLIGEVSTVNDDETDNWFAEPIGRFASIEEDVARRICWCPITQAGGRWRLRGPRRDAMRERERVSVRRGSQPWSKGGAGGF